jgi:hypothetical protein
MECVTNNLKVVMLMLSWLTTQPYINSLTCVQQPPLGHQKSDSYLEGGCYSEVGPKYEKKTVG